LLTKPTQIIGGRLLNKMDVDELEKLSLGYLAARESEEREFQDLKTAVQNNTELPVQKLVAGFEQTLERGVRDLGGFLYQIEVKDSLELLAERAGDIDDYFSTSSRALEKVCESYDRKHREELQKLQQNERRFDECNQRVRNCEQDVNHQRNQIVSNENQVEHCNNSLRDAEDVYRKSKAKFEEMKAQKEHNDNMLWLGFLGGPLVGAIVKGVGGKINLDTWAKAIEDSERAKNGQWQAMRDAEERLSNSRATYEQSKSKLRGEEDDLRQARDARARQNTMLEDAKRSLEKVRKLIAEVKSAYAQVKDLPTASENLVKATEHQVRMGAFGSIESVATSVVTLTDKLLEVEKSIPGLDFDYRLFENIRDHKSHIEKRLESAKKAIDVEDWL